MNVSDRPAGQCEHDPIWAGLSQDGFDEKLVQIYCAAVNGCPQDLPLEILNSPAVRQYLGYKV